MLGELVEWKLTFTEASMEVAQRLLKLKKINMYSRTGDETLNSSWRYVIGKYCMFIKISLIC